MLCSVEDCSSAHTARGFCHAHYKRFKKHGSPTAGGPFRPRRRKYPRICAAPECRNPSHTLGYCHAHYARHQKGQSLLPPLKASRGEGCITREGYRVLSIDYRRCFEHRLVMEQTLGRELLPGENVHHINGDRLDNRPENLELWVTYQPPGQRPEDLLAYAYEIIERYGR